MEYNLSTKIRGKEIKFRKLKVKDKKRFKQAIKNNVNIVVDIINDCLEDKTLALSENEMKYILLCIRSQSLGESLTFNINCLSCEKEYEYTGKILEIQKPNFKDFGKIVVGDISFTMSEIPNKEYYEDSIRQCKTKDEMEFIDFLFHVKKLNGTDAFTFDQLFEYVNDMDLTIGEEVFRQWDEMKLTFDSIVDIKCPHCDEINTILFDELYGFFPADWLS